MIFTTPLSGLYIVFLSVPLFQFLGIMSMNSHLFCGKSFELYLQELLQGDHNAISSLGKHLFAQASCSIMSEITTVNPFTNEVLERYEKQSLDSIKNEITKIREHQKEWKRDIDERIDYLRNVLRPNLEKHLDEIARQMTLEMGKTISQSKTEVQRCIDLIGYYVDNAKKLLEIELVKTEAKDSYIRFDPLGVIMAIEPWNSPSLQAVRAAVPALVAGNGVILKHASIVSGSSRMLERVFDSPLFKSVVTDGPTALSAVKFVDGIAFTGSSETGAKIAEEAGRNLKKVVMELGGSDPFIVMKSADVGFAAKNATRGRLRSAGQSCIASKRFIVHEDVYDEFYSKLKDEFSSVIIGDPMEPNTFLGPVSSTSQKNIVMRQINDLSTRSKIDVLGKSSGNIIAPTIIRIEEQYQEEIFGPVALLKKYKTNEEAVRMANETPYGLGSSIWGEPEDTDELIPNIEAGTVYVNKVVTSDPRLPFGGVKKSGIGRELSRYGLLEYTNIKSVWVEGRQGS